MGCSVSTAAAFVFLALGKQVIVSGLDTDYMGRPFTPIPELLCLAVSITKTLAILYALRQSRQAHAAARCLR
jgi:thymidine kinase